MEKVFQHYRGIKPENWDTGEKELVSDLVRLAPFIDKIDDSILQRLRLSLPYVEINHNGYSFVEELNRLVAANPKEVGLVYLEMLKCGVYPLYKKETVISIVESLYAAGEKQTANGICNAYGQAGHDFLRSVWEHHNRE